MAKATKVERKVELVEKEISPERFEVELSADEAANLAALLGNGVHWKTLEKMNLNSLYDELSKQVGWKKIGLFNPGFKNYATHGNPA